MAQLEKEIAGALKATIRAHGAINEDNIPSAAKRIAAAIREEAKRERDALMRTTPRTSEKKLGQLPPRP